MRRWAKPAAVSLLALVAPACPRPGPSPGPAAAPPPELRIGLATGVASLTLGGDGELFVTDEDSGEPVGSIPPGASWAVVSDGAGLRLAGPAGSAGAPGPGGTPAARHRAIVAVNVTEHRFAMANGRRYRGRIGVTRDASGLTLTNRVPVESYLAGVVGGEIGIRRGAERQAMLAQAVVSRSFALKNRGRWESLGFDAWADVRDQVYAGVSGETPEVWDAVRATGGEVLRYDGEVIDAYFHSTCGSRTAAVNEAFRDAVPRPYLRPVSDASGGGHYYCERSPRYRWREEWDGAKLRAILSRTLPALMNAGGGGLQRVTDVAVSRTTASGRVAELRIVFPHGEALVPGPEVRAVLRPEPDRLLQSAAFRLFVTRREGEVAHLTAAGTGSGHGVGLCQWGAVGRARAGQDYHRILATYFPGTTIERLY